MTYRNRITLSTNNVNINAIDYSKSLNVCTHDFMYVSFMSSLNFPEIKEK